MTPKKPKGRFSDDLIDQLLAKGVDFNSGRNKGTAAEVLVLL